MTLSDMYKADLDVFYNTDEFAKKCIFEGKEIAVLFQKNEIFISEISLERIKVRQSDIENLEVGKQLEIEGVSYEIINFIYEKDYQISIEIRKINA